MEKVQLGSWLIQYNETENALRVLINDEYLLAITAETIDSVLEAMENITDEALRVVLPVQHMVRQTLVPSYDYYTEDGEPEETSKLNYDISTTDLSQFHVDSVLLEVGFDTSGDARNFYRDMLDHPAVDWIM